MNILVVEDSAIITNLIKIILNKAGYNILSTSEGAKVVDIVKKEKISLVILDLMMPGMTGSDVLKRLKTDPGTKDVKVMILTAKTDATRWDESLKVCDKFMTKPFDNAVLVAEVKKMIGK